MQEKNTLVNQADAFENVNLFHFEGDNEEKEYLILVVSENSESDTDDLIKDWFILVGRQNTYDSLMNYIESGFIQAQESFIIPKGSKIEEGITVFDFMKKMKEEKRVFDDSDFEIEDYRIIEEAKYLFESEKEE